MSQRFLSVAWVTRLIKIYDSMKGNGVGEVKFSVIQIVDCRLWPENNVYVLFIFLFSKLWTKSIDPLMSFCNKKSRVRFLLHTLARLHELGR